VALGSASERYLVRLAHRLGMLSQADRDALVERYSELIRATQALIASLRGPKSAV
jgi:hypothetical protein